MAAAQMGYNYGNGTRLRRLKRRVVGKSGTNSAAHSNVANSGSLASGIGSRLTSLVSNRYSQYVVSTLLRRKTGAVPVVESAELKLAPYADLHESNASLYSDSNTLVNSTRPAYTSSSSSSSSVIFDDDTTLIEHPKRYVEPIKEVPEAVAESCDTGSYIRNFFHSHASELGESQHLHYYQLPFAWRENRFIIKGYRFYNSHQKSALSIVNWYGWHNETSNIWTHLLGGLYLLYLAFFDFPHSQVWDSEQVPLPAKFIVYIFLFAGIKCLFASVFWHTFNGTTALNLRSKFACVDYSGITLLITASIMTAEFVTMYDNKFCLYLYMLVSSVLGMFGIFMNWSPMFDRPEARPLRIKFFVLLSTMGFLSVFQLAWEKSWAYTSWLMLPVTKKSLVWYLIGVFFYGSFIPERFRTDFLVDESIPTEEQLSSDITVLTKHKHIHFRAEPTKHPKALQCSCHSHSFRSLWWVDYFGCSHMIWHFFVVLGVVGHYHAILDMFIKRWIT